MSYLHLQQDPIVGYFGCGSDCQCAGVRTSVHRSFGEPTSTNEFSEAEREMVASEVEKIVVSKVKPGIRHVNQWSDQIFFARHPDRNWKLIDPKTEPNLAEEWKIIKSRLVLPILDAIDSKEKGNQAYLLKQFIRAIGFYDRARRISISPALVRARATFNLGLANFQLKRFAAAIGYFEIVRTFPGISKDLEVLKALRDNAERKVMLAKEEYSKAVPTT